MQRELDGAAARDVGGRVQALMEEYLRLQETEVGSGALGDGDRSAATPEGRSLTPHPPLPTPEALKQQVVEEMAPVVEAIARRYRGDYEGSGGQETLEDLISEGYVGLLTAIDQYRGDRGARFSTYATHRVHGQIRHYLRDRGNRRLIRAPSWLQELASRLHHEETKLLGELGRRATATELAERLNLKEEAVVELLARGSGPAVLSLTEGGDDEDEGGVDLSKIRSQQYVSWQLPVEDHIFLEGLIGRLKDLERQVIQLFFFQEFSQSEIARSLNISCNYVGYLLNNGLRRLRKLIEADELRDAHLRVSYAPRRIADVTGVIDAATGLYNADYFRSRLSEEIARACRQGRKLAVVLARVPLPAGGGGETGRQGEGETRRRGETGKRGKAGRSPRRAAPPPQPVAVRDAMLRELGVALRECLRKADIPAWLGEGTFAAALLHTGEGAAAVAERMTLLLSQVAGGPASCGVAVYPADAREPGGLLELAAARAQGSAAPWQGLRRAGSRQ